MKDLAGLMEKEKELFEELKRAVVDQKKAMIDRDIDGMNEALSRIERISLEIERMDSLRNTLLSDLKEKLGLSRKASITDLLNRLDENSREVLLDSLSKFLKVVNDLALELQGMKEMLDFENAYFEFLKSLIVPVESSRGMYSRTGEYRNAGAGGTFDSRW